MRTIKKMKYIHIFSLFLAIIVTSGCAADLSCEEPEAYQSAVESNKIISPEGLDQLQEDRELKIVRASPKNSRSANSPCLDEPPRILSQESNF